MTPEEKFARDRFETLDSLTKAIARVHGEHHPELKEVREEFLKMKEKAEKGEYEFKEEMKKIADLSKNFKIPDDACEAYTGVYTQLAELNGMMV